MIMMCQCRFINSKKHPILVGDADNGRGYACIGSRGSTEAPYLLSCAVNLKLLKNFFLLYFIF